MKRLALVGAGHAHLPVLRAVAQRPLAATDVVLITQFEHQNYSGMVPGWAARHYKQSDCRIDLRPLVQAAGVRLLLARVVALNAVQRILCLSDGQSLDYDLLPLDVGSETGASWLETLGQKLLPVKPLGNLFAAWPEILARARAKRDYRVIVVGAGGAGVEIALAAQCAFRLDGINADIDLVSSESGLLPRHPTKVQAGCSASPSGPGWAFVFCAASTPKGVSCLPMAASSAPTLSLPPLAPGPCLAGTDPTRAGRWRLYPGRLSSPRRFAS